MSKEEVLKDYYFRESSTQAAIKLFDAICNRGWNLRQGDYEIMKGVIREFSSTYAASLLAEKESKRMDNGVYLDLLKIMEIFNRIEDTDFGGYSILRPDESKFINDFKEKHKI